jgi:hypothetical protein
MEFRCQYFDMTELRGAVRCGNEGNEREVDGVPVVDAEGAGVQGVGRDEREEDVEVKGGTCS